MRSILNVKKENIRRVTKFDTINYHVLDSMEDLVRVSSADGTTIFENTVMKKAVRDEALKQALDSNHKSALSDYAKDLKLSIRKEVDVGNKTYSLNISPVLENGSKLLGYVEVFRDITYESAIRRELIKMTKKTHEDTSLARNIQKAILPKMEAFNNLKFQYGHVASEQLSGDIFDVIQIDDHRIGIYIADVVGHGISASIMTMFIRQTMRNIISELPDKGVSDKVLELKRRFSKLNLDVSQYFTLVYAEIDTEKKKMTYVNAGHNAPPIMANDESVALMKNRGPFISNIFPAFGFNEMTLDLIPGYRFFFYTDGLLETADMNGNFFGQERFMRWIMKNANEKFMIDKLIRDLNSFRWLEQKDDIAILYMSVE
ncbi:MAG: PP2C family protein-serine/threonine phosphatase [Tissierellia bacterium]|nr:PP2C family protein-serine/threonine phosphatase [Tissierellia bacterium]